MFDRDLRHDQFVSVFLMDADGCHRFYCRHQPLIHGKRSHRGRDVATVSLVIDERAVEGYLAEIVDDIIRRVGGSADDGGLAGGGDRSAQPVDLAPVGVRTAKSGENDLVSFPGIPGQMIGRERKFLCWCRLS